MSARSGDSMKNNDQQTKALEQWIRVAATKVPSLTMSVKKGDLVVAWRGGEVRIPKSRVGNSAQTAELLKQVSYLDLETGTLRVEEDGVLILVQCKLPSLKLTPFLSALLARILLPTVFPGEYTRLPLAARQNLLAKEWSRELGVEITTVATNKLIKILEAESLLGNGERDSQALQFERSFDLLVSQFRIGGIGRSERYFDLPGSMDELIQRFPTEVASGVADTLSQLARGWVEPRDFIVNQNRITSIVEALGQPAPKVSNNTIIIRQAKRVPLELLCPRPIDKSTQVRLNPILAVCDALNSSDPVIEELGIGLRDKWLAL